MGWDTIPIVNVGEGFMVKKSYVVSFMILGGFSDKVLVENVWATSPEQAVEKIKEKYIGVYSPKAKLSI